MSCCQRSSNPSPLGAYTKPAMEIKEIHLPDNRTLVEAIYAQDLNATIKILDDNPKLSNSWVSLHASNYKEGHYRWFDRTQYFLGTSKFKVNTVEPILIFAATIHHYKGGQTYSHEIPEESLRIVQALVDYGASFSHLEPNPYPMKPEIDWAYMCFEYIPDIQDSAAIIRLLILAGANPGAHGSHGLYCAARYDAGETMGVLLDWILGHKNLKLWDCLKEIHMAAQFGSRDVISAFLQRGGTPLIDLPYLNGYGQWSQSTLLRTTILYPPDDYCDVHGFDGRKRETRIRLICDLVDAGADKDVIQIQDICKWVSLAIFSRFISGKNINQKLSYYTEKDILSNNTDPGEEEFHHEHQLTILHLVAAGSNYHVIKWLIENGLQTEVVDSQGRTPLHYLCIGSRTRASRPPPIPIHNSTSKLRAEQTAVYLLELTRVDINQQDRQGRTALFYACYFHSTTLIQTLLNHGARLGITDNNGNTPIHAFAKDEFPAELEFDAVINLPKEITYSANFTSTLKTYAESEGIVNAVNRNGMTALSLACKAFSIERVKVLINIGISPNIQDNNLQTALHHSMRRPKRLHRRAGMVNQDRTTSFWDIGAGMIQEMKQLLLEVGADENLLNSQGKTAADLADEETRMIVDDRDILLEDIKEDDKRRHNREIEAQRRQEELQRLILQARVKAYPSDHVPRTMLEQFGLGRGRPGSSRILRGLTFRSSGEAYSMLHVGSAFRHLPQQPSTDHTIPMDDSRFGPL